MRLAVEAEWGAGGSRLPRSGQFSPQRRGVRSRKANVFWDCASAVQMKTGPDRDGRVPFLESSELGTRSRGALDGSLSTPPHATGALDGSLSTPPHATLSEQEPIERDILLGGECDQEIGMRRGAVFVAIDVLLEDTQVSCKLSL